MIVLPVTVLVVSAFFVIRGYVLEEDSIWVQRLFWKTRIPLSELVSAEADPSAMSRSLRTFGNGGLFCFAGFFRNKTLGSYRAFAADPRNSVVLRFPHRTVVVTPEEPQRFVRALQERC
jgi:hypothetical protein